VPIGIARKSNVTEKENPESKLWIANKMSDVLFLVWEVISVLTGAAVSDIESQAIFEFKDLKRG